jgi:hypothetical protein
LQEILARLGTWMPFGRAAEALGWVARTAVSEATAARVTEATGAAYAAVQDAEVARLEAAGAAAAPGPAVQLVSADGAMVPLVGGDWAEVKTLAIGVVEPPANADAPGGPRTTALSYFSRLADATTFSRLALGEFQRRGTDAAGVVVAPMDGSPWLQKLLDRHCPRAVRILDFPHGVEHLSAAAQATFGPETAAATAWLTEQAHVLKYHDPDTVLAELRALPTAQARDPAAAAAARAATLGYLAQRRDQIRYPEFLARGYPIASGCVESANKLVVEARLKGSGMHWAPAHVNPLLALRTAVCNDRWAEAWPRACAQRRADERARRQARHRAHRPPPPSPRPAPPPATPPPLRLSPPPRPKRIIDGRPTKAHPWNRRFLAPRLPANSKL